MGHTILDSLTEPLWGSDEILGEKGLYSGVDTMSVLGQSRLGKMKTAKETGQRTRQPGREALRQFIWSKIRT